MKGFTSTRLILLQPSLPKHGTSGGILPPASYIPTAHNRLWLIALVSFFSFASLFTLLSTSTRNTLPGADPGVPISIPSVSTTALHPHIFDALVHYAAQSAATGQMSESDLRAVAGVIRHRAPCNLLVLGLGPESLLWRALNHGGRTVFVDENQYYIAHFEERHPGIEGYDVAYTTKVSELHDLLTAAREQVAGECRPVQNLLFSDCRLGINDLPNHIYDVAWDVILVDGPRGYSPASPGRMSTIFTAGVLARSGDAGPTDVLVHDYEREVERLCSAEFLCGENLVAAHGQLAHFAIRGGPAARKDDFCFNRTAGAAAVTL
ncbi:hypothetical protein HPP92_010144 [Vanilla planifolia]|uniref:Polysaccharide biosynthesis domain-containing protein n=1 Tax=Vanilla planifolia TaxID=51239 RepID=A0A835QYG3_VANPL|nr:hypothetical protein HPP92_010364 [Vanilla planifolia]KAG0482060.1 hypothetical protein HPP92_010144 [Vanilla planifolia]